MSQKEEEHQQSCFESGIAVRVGVSLSQPQSSIVLLRGEKETGYWGAGGASFSCRNVR